MKTILATRARDNLYRLMDEVTESSEPVQICGRRSSVVMVSEADWRSLQETLYLMAIPGMTESILAAREAPDSDFSDDRGW